MGDMGDVFRAWDAEKRARRERNLEGFDPTGWTKHTEYHYARRVLGHKLDYWPSKKKWMYLGKVSTGDVYEFIEARIRAAEGTTVPGILEGRPGVDADRVSDGEPDNVGSSPASVLRADGSTSNDDIPF